MKNSNLKYIAPAFLGAALIFGVASAGQKPAPSEQSTSPSQKTAFHAYQKPGPAVRFTHNLSENVEPGAISSVRIDLKDEYGAGTVKVSIVETPGLHIYSDQRELEFDMASGQAKQFEIQFGSKQAGRHLLNFITTVELPDGQVLKRANAIPVNIGQAEAVVKSAAPVVSSAKSSGGIVVMEAEETISSR